MLAPRRTTRSFLQLLVLLTLLLGGRASPAAAQTCLPQGITFSTQAQIDAFPANYPGCTTIAGDLVIQESAPGDIVNLRGLAQITVLAQALDINRNAALSDFSGLDAVAMIGDRLSIVGNAALVNINGLKNLGEVGQSIRIAANPSLQDISALRGIQRVNKDLLVESNASLPSLSGLDSIKTVDGDLLVNFNPALNNLHGLEAVRTVARTLLVSNNERLKSMHGLSALTAIGEDLIIDNNPSLNALNGLNKLRTVGRYLQIVNLKTLENLNGLDAVVSINGLLQIYNNSALISLAGIDSIDHATIKDLAILSCPELTDCSVKSVCGYLNRENEQYSISLNDERCNSREIILQFCRNAGVNSTPPSNQISFYPNPTTGRVRIKGEGVESAPVRVTDGLGRLVWSGRVEQNAFDLSGLPGGIYYIRLVTERLNLAAPVCIAE